MSDSVRKTRFRSTTRETSAYWPLNICTKLANAPKLCVRRILMSQDQSGLHGYEGFSVYHRPVCGLNKYQHSLAFSSPFLCVCIYASGCTYFWLMFLPTSRIFSLCPATWNQRKFHVHSDSIPREYENAACSPLKEPLDLPAPDIGWLRPCILTLHLLSKMTRW